MSRLLWMAVGVGVGAFAVAKARQYPVRTARPAIGDRVTVPAGSAVTVRGRAAGFVDRVRAGMAEREAELRAELGLARLTPTDSDITED